MDDETFLVVGDSLPRIGSVEPLAGHRVRIVWSEGDRAGNAEDLDLAPAIFNHRHFVPLRADDALFRAVAVADWGSALAWPGGIELAAEWVARLPRTAMSNVQFRRSMDELGMTLDGMAATLGIGRRTIAAFRKDKPIPPYVVLALRELGRSGSHRKAGLSLPA